MKKQDFEFILKLLENNAGWNFNEDLYFVIDKKISNFVREKGFNSTEELIYALKSGNSYLIQQIVETLALSNTSFFRDFDEFVKFEKILLPKLKEKCRATKKINIWSIGCSSGQEPYSIAMVLKRNHALFADWQIKITGSDLSSVLISKAQRGAYNNFEVQTGLNIRSIMKFFDYKNDSWQIKDELKQMVEFRKYNLLDEAISKSKFEVIFCRNVLRYFSRDYQEKILEKISKKQPQGGYLYLGKEEIIPAIEKFYTPLNKNNGAYMLMQNNEKKENSTIYKAKENELPSFVKPNSLIS